MAITYPLALPTVVGIKNIVIAPKSVVAASRSPFTGEQQIQKHPGQWLEAQVTLPLMTRAEAEEWFSFFLKLDGKYGTFLMGDPAGETARGIATGTPLVNGASQTGNELITDGWTANQTGILKAGDWIQLGSGAASRLYKNLIDINSDGSGNATLTLWPNLRSSPGDNDPLTISSAKGRWRLTENSVPFSINEAVHYETSFNCVEAI
jgi:hypothetical protein